MTGRRAVAGSFALVAAAKLALLLWLGPIWAGDTGGYFNYATAILAGTGWMHDGGVDQGLAGALTFRMAGYPLVLAAARGLFGGGWAWAVVLLQGGVSLWTTWRLMQVAQQATGSARIAAAAGMAWGLSRSLAVDQALLTDSLYTSATLAVALAGVQGWLQPQFITLRRAVVAGFLLAASLLVRESGLFFAPCLLLPWAVPVWRARGGQGLLAVALLAPVVLTWGGYRAWNQHRTGAAFLSTGGATVLLFSLVRMREAGADPFAGIEPLDVEARATLRQHTFEESCALLKLHRQQENLGTLAVLAELQDRFAAAWLQHPVAVLQARARHLPLRLLFTPFAPVDAVADAWQWGHDQQKLWPDDSVLLQQATARPASALILFGLALTRMVGLAVTVLGLLGPLWLWWHRRRQPDDLARLAMALWVAALAMVAVYFPVHIEVRYVQTSTALLILAAALAAAAWHRFPAHEQGRR